ncbi:MAG: hypothetical protein R3B06_19370 [Kofleriaceae bacterium]
MISARQAAAAVVAMAVSAAVLVGARALLGGWLMSDGLGAAQRPLRAGPITPGPRRQPVRVIVVDGLTAADATTPAWAALCRRGLDLTVDVGFPTKSLPVQAVLWSGLTQQQLGLGPSNAPRPRLPALVPAQVPGARAVVQAWTRIARAVGFAEVEPGVEADPVETGADPAAVAAWAGAFPGAARRAVASRAPLVMVHILDVDQAAHHGGRASARYRRAVADADALVATLVAARPDAAWVLVADHGHRAAGGHGDAERSIRLVRACVTPAPPGAHAGQRGAVHLVDLAQHVRSLLGVAAHPAAVGRPLASAMAAPDPDATLPRPSRAAAAVAGGLALLTALAALRWLRPRWAALWLPVALVASALVAGVPTLSARPAPWAPLVAGACALPAAWACRRRAGALWLVAAVGVAGAVVAAWRPACRRRWSTDARQRALSHRGIRDGERGGRGWAGRGRRSAGGPGRAPTSMRPISDVR